MIDHESLRLLAGSGTAEDFRKSHASWVEEALRKKANKRERRWSKSIAIGSKRYIGGIIKKLRHKARGRRIEVSESGVELREHVSDYKADFDAENSALSPNNSHFWSDTH